MTTDGRPMRAEEQDALLPAPVRRPRASGGVVPAAASPVGVVAVDVPLAHLDRPFEYLIPDTLTDQAVPGVRVKVRFAGKDVDGYLLERREEAEHGGNLSYLRKVVSDLPVLTPELLQVCRAVADDQAGTLMDVLRLAIPPRHARAEARVRALTAPERLASGDPERALPGAAWASLPAGEAFLSRLSAGQAVRASVLALPGHAPGTTWPDLIADAVVATARGGRRSVVVVPDHRDVERVSEALESALGSGAVVRLTSDLGPEGRYAAWTTALLGHVTCVVGTRAASFAPVPDLGLVAWWDDGDDLLDEPRAPYPHARRVLLRRAEVGGAAVLTAGYSRSVAVAQLATTHDVMPLNPSTAEVRERVPRVQVAGEGPAAERDPLAARARIPSAAHRAASSALRQGPVLVQVPRGGYVPALSCATCRAPLHCRSCGGGLAAHTAGAGLRCRLCGRDEPQPRCGTCGPTTARATIVGAGRTAEELGRAFPGVPVVSSGSGNVLGAVGSEPALVVATPGAEPIADGGYAAVLLLDGWALLEWPGLDAAEEALRRWLGAAALCRPHREGGLVVLCGVPPHAQLPAVEALVRWDPAWMAARELAEREELRLPPVSEMVALRGGRRALREALEGMVLGTGVEVLGPTLHEPTPVDRALLPPAPGEDASGTWQALLRVAPAGAPALMSQVQAMRAARSARKDPARVQVIVAPRDLGF